MRARHRLDGECSLIRCASRCGGVLKRLAPSDEPGGIYIRARRYKLQHSYRSLRRPTVRWQITGLAIGALGVSAASSAATQKQIDHRVSSTVQHFNSINAENLSLGRKAADMLGIGRRQWQLRHTDAAKADSGLRVC